MLKKYIKVLEQRLNEAEFTAYEQEAWTAELEEQLRRSTDSGHDGTESQGEGEGPVRQEVRALREEVARRGMHRADSPAVEGAAPSPPVVASLSQEEAETMYSAGLEMEVQAQKDAREIELLKEMLVEQEHQVRAA
jgi:uncharacterized coiled-coil protein SlyX